MNQAAYLNAIAYQNQNILAQMKKESYNLWSKTAFQPPSWVIKMAYKLWDTTGIIKLDDMVQLIVNKPKKILSDITQMIAKKGNAILSDAC